MGLLFSPGYDPTTLENHAASAKNNAVAAKDQALAAKNTAQQVLAQVNSTAHGLSVIKGLLEAGAGGGSSEGVDLSPLLTQIQQVLGHVDELEGLLKNNTYGLAKLGTFVDDIPAIKVQADRLSHANYGLPQLKTLLDGLNSLLQHAGYGLSPLKTELDGLEALLKHPTYGLSPLQTLASEIPVLKSQLEQVQQALPAPAAANGVTAPVVTDPRQLPFYQVHSNGLNVTASSGPGSPFANSWPPLGTSHYKYSTTKGNTWVTVFSISGGGYLLHLLSTDNLSHLRLRVDGQLINLTVTANPGHRAAYGPLVILGREWAGSFLSNPETLRQPHVPILRFASSLSVEYRKSNSNNGYASNCFYYSYVLDNELPAMS